MTRARDPGAGLTLIEVLIVLAIIGVMAGVTVLGDQLFVRGGRSGELKTMVDGLPVSDSFGGAGGVGTLCHTYEGKIRHLDYKTIRYPGHLELIRFLIDDLGFKEHPEELVEIFQRSIPATLDDFVIVSVRGLGTAQGRYMEKTYWRRVPGRYLGKHFFTGIEISTAAGVCGVLHLLLLGEMPQKGFVKIEQVSYDRFMETPFGRYYARPGQAGRHGEQ